MFIWRDIDASFNDILSDLEFGGSDLLWTLQAMFGRRYSNDNRLALCVRVWGVDYSQGKGLLLIWPIMGLLLDMILINMEYWIENLFFTSN